MRKTVFATGERYHIYNRGVDKRNIFADKEDLMRFLKSMEEFNCIDPIGSIFEQSFRKSLGGSTSKLVNIVAYCLNQNHFHFILEPLIDEGVQKFMHRLSTGYTGYFNEKYERSGSLYQGRYKSIHIETNEYLLHLSVYINLNNNAHPNLNEVWLEQLPFSSRGVYCSGEISKLCDPRIVLQQFQSTQEYRRYAEQVLPDILERKEQEKELRNMLAE